MDRLGNLIQVEKYHGVDKSKTKNESNKTKKHIFLSSKVYYPPAIPSWVPGSKA